MLDNIIIVLFSFIDKLSFFDIFCLVLLNLAIILFIVDLCTNFRISCVANYFYSLVIICWFLLAFAYSKIQKISFFEIKPTYYALSLVLFVSFCFFLSYIRSILLNFKFKYVDNNTMSQNNNNVNIKTDSNINHELNSNVETKQIGVYDNYEYYYSKPDKYEEPYTNNLQQTSILSIQNNNLDNHYEEKTDIVRNEKDKKNDNTMDDVFKKSSLLLNNSSENNKNSSNQLQSNTDYCTKAVDVLNDRDNINIETIENNLLKKVNVLLEENNALMDKKVANIDLDLNNIKIGVQSMIDKLTKLFELLTIAIQKNNS